jgi:hypothetical protein
MRQDIGRIDDDRSIRDLLASLASPAVRDAAVELAAAELLIMEVDDEPAQMRYAQALVDWAPPPQPRPTSGPPSSIANTPSRWKQTSSIPISSPGWSTTGATATTGSAARRRSTAGPTIWSTSGRSGSTSSVNPAPRWRTRRGRCRW